MARLLIILIVGLICEAIGVVFLSRGLKEILWFLTDREVKDSSALADKLVRHADPTSELIWQSLTERDRAVLNDRGSSPARKKRLLVRALNAILLEPSFSEAERYGGTRLSPETRELLEQHPEGNDLVQLNRLLLQDTYPEALTRTEGSPGSVSQALPLVGRGVTNTHILLGVFFEALFFIGLLVLMSKADVSFIWPLTSLGFVVTTIAAKVYLHEQVSSLRWSGVCLIMLGAALISWTEQAKHSHPAQITGSAASRSPAPQ